VDDKPGVLAEIAQVFADHDVSILAVRQDGEGERAGLIIRTHAARDQAMTDTIAAVADLPAVSNVAGVMRVVGDE
jgi:homoserine dehydrogenase